MQGTALLGAVVERAEKDEQKRDNAIETGKSR